MESQPLVSKTAKEEDDNDSVGEKSFLSDFLNNRAANKGTTKQRKGVSTSSKGTSLNADDDDDQKSDNFKEKYQTFGHNNILGTARQHIFTAIRTIQQWHKDGYLCPTSRIEFVRYGLLALILAPMIHVLIMIITGAGHKHAAKHNYTTKTANLHTKVDAVGNAGISHVMLSSSSSVRENVILVPDAAWLDLPPKPPKRVALPPRLDPRGRASSTVVLFALSASKNGSNSAKNIHANTNLWNSIQNDLRPRPLDAWPSWYHNSGAHIREDGFTVMYSIRKRDEATSSLKQLAEEFGKPYFYEFVAWDESFEEEGIEIMNTDIPPLPRKQTDVMVRRRIPTSSKATESSEVLVMRRVKDLPVENDLTLRDFEGPSTEDVVWNHSS